jgi:CheY-like chemotaxis protein
VVPDRLPRETVELLVPEVRVRLQEAEIAHARIAQAFAIVTRRARPNTSSRGTQTTAQAARQALPMEPPLVLCVEDDPAVSRCLQRILRRAGWNVVGVPNGWAALAILPALDAPPALIVTDLEMPVLDGAALVRALRGNPAYARIPVVLVSSEAAPGLGVAWVAKPFGEADLLAMVERLIGRPDAAGAGRNAAGPDHRARGAGPR